MQSLNGSKFAGLRADPTLDAFILIDHMQLLELAADRLNRTFFDTLAAPLAFLRIDPGLEQGLALAGGTHLVFDVGFVLIGKMAQG